MPSFSQPGYQQSTHLASASETLRRAFAHDPVIRYYIPEDGLYDRRGAEAFGYFCWVSSQTYDGVQCICADADDADDADGADEGQRGGGGAKTVASVAVWAPPLAEETWAGRLRLIRMLGWMWWAGGWATVKTIVSGITDAEEKQKELGCADCDHLLYLGTDSSLQGLGLGSRLLKAGIERAERRGKDCYLEATNPANVRLYQRHGFKVLAVHAIDGGQGPPITLMRRTRNKDL